MTGEWVEVVRPLYAPQGTSCQACGAPVRRRFWTPDGERVYCRPDCLELELRVDELRGRYPEAARPDADRGEP